MRATWVVSAGAMILGLCGCASEREELEQERTRLVTQREQIHNQLAPSNSRWDSHADSQRLIQASGDANDRIRAIDRQLQKY